MSKLIRDYEIDGERFAVYLETEHQGAVAKTAVHHQVFERRIGGARFVVKEPPVREDDGDIELGNLSKTMTKKCLAAMIPADGQKTMVLTPGSLPSEERRAEILIEHLHQLKEADPGVIVGPDMECPESVMDRVAQAQGLLDHVTGLTSAVRGLAIDTNGYTAQGLAAAIRAAIGDDSLAKQRISIQGFGAVGAHTGRLLAEVGGKIVAINNKDVLLCNADGLDVQALFTPWHEQGDEGLRTYSAKDVTVSAVPDEIFQVPADIFVPAARTDVLATADELQTVRKKENRDVRDVAKFLSATGVWLVAEGANHPLSEKAEEWLEKQGVKLLPDYIVNCGGLIGCWFEWKARHHSDSKPIDLVQLGKDALDQISTIVTQNVKEILAASTRARNAAEPIVKRNREKLMRAARPDSGSTRE